MDTKWKHTASAAAGFLAFFFGVSLTIGSLGQAVGRVAWEQNSNQWWMRDYQQTEPFAWEMSAYLQEFLTIGAGGELDWYNLRAMQAERGGAFYEEYAVVERSVTAVLQDATETPVVLEEGTEPPAVEQSGPYDPAADYELDKNVLYRIEKKGVLQHTNASAAQNLTQYSKLPEGYNFLMTYADGKVSITRDGKAWDVYGDGIYREDSRWCVPGYENFQAGTEVAGITVSIAVRQTPIPYFQGNYADGGVDSTGRLYHLVQSMEESRQFYLTRAIAFLVGLALCGLWLCLGQDKKRADAALARLTRPVWTEIRALAVLGSLSWLPLGRQRFCNVTYELWNMVQHEDVYSCVGSLRHFVWGLLENTPALLTLLWLLWLIHNDHRYNPKDARRSLLQSVAARPTRYPFQTQVSRWNKAALAASLLPVAVSLLLGMAWGIDYDQAAMFLLPAVLSTLLVWLALRRGGGIARDAGALAAQISAVHGGELDLPLQLPQDTDLHAAAVQLNDIQSGMRVALAEQTHSERMKVELISNVSHDLKTPLTSILSYAELLGQEDLPPAAADYARIIDEKAQRLSAMVQDVFEVSKAAAGQLPVQLERLDLAKLLRQTLADLEDPLRQSALVFKTDLPEEPVLIVADGKRLYRVFQNLLQNTLLYALEGSRVYLTLTIDQGRAEAALRNTSRSELPAGVDFTARFVRGDESRTGTGSGLGLSIAASFTEACGGAFRVETVADLFTAVVSFPLAENPEPAP